MPTETKLMIQAHTSFEFAVSGEEDDLHSRGSHVVSICGWPQLRVPKPDDLMAFVAALTDGVPFFKDRPSRIGAHAHGTDNVCNATLRSGNVS